MGFFMERIDQILDTLPWTIEARKAIKEASNKPDLRPNAKRLYLRMLILNKIIIKAYADSMKCPHLKT